MPATTACIYMVAPTDRLANARLFTRVNHAGGGVSTEALALRGRCGSQQYVQQLNNLRRYLAAACAGCQFAAARGLLRVPRHDARRHVDGCAAGAGVRCAQSRVISAHRRRIASRTALKT